MLLTNVPFLVYAAQSDSHGVEKNEDKIRTPAYCLKLREISVHFYIRKSFVHMVTRQGLWQHLKENAWFTQNRKNLIRFNRKFCNTFK